MHCPIALRPGRLGDELCVVRVSVRLEGGWWWCCCCELLLERPGQLASTVRIRSGVFLLATESAGNL